jgi:transposase
MSEGLKELKQKDRATQMAEVLRLHLMEGKAIRAICRQTGLDRKKVREMLGSATSKPRKATGERRPSLLDPYEAELRKLLEDCADIRAPAALDRLRANGYQGGLTIVRVWLRRLRPRPAQEAFFTRSYEAGRMLQVDWGLERRRIMRRPGHRRCSSWIAVPKTPGDARYGGWLVA